MAQSSSFRSDPAYRPEIDGLRAIAVLPVILFHAGIGPFTGGFAGVDVFFVISGYLIAMLILRDLAAGEFSLGAFYERRARRLLPALLAVTAICVPLALLVMMPADLIGFARSLVAVATFSSNLLFWSESGYFAPATDFAPLVHTWSLAVEEQFYLLFPLALMAVWRWGRGAVVLLLVSGLIASLTLAILAVEYRPNAAFYLLPTRAWELLLGALGAVWVLRRGTLSKGPLAQVAGLGGLGAIGLAMVIFDKAAGFPGAAALVPTLGALAVLVAAVPGTLVHRLLCWRPLVGIGLISYSAYLWHQPLFAFARHAALDAPAPWVFGVLTGVTLALAWLTWRLVETPFRRPGPLPVFGALRRGPVLGVAAAGCATLALTGALGVARDGLPGRLAATEVARGDIGHLTFHRHLDLRHHDCAPDAVRAAAERWAGHLRCKQSAPGVAEVVLVGDSHAEHLYPGLAEALTGRTVAFHIRSASPYLDTPAFGAIFDDLLGNGRDQTVILTFHYANRLRTPARRAAFADRLGATVARLRAAGKHVVLVGDVPRFDRDPQRCATPLAWDPRRGCAIAQDVADTQATLYAATLSRLAARHGADLVRIDDLFCDGTHCRMTRGDTILYRDGHHLNLPGARLAGAAVVTRSPRLSALQAPTGAPDLAVEDLLTVKAE